MTLRSKFRACLLGALAGDALGQKFEGMSLIPFEELTAHIENSLTGGISGCNSCTFEFTDDTAMTRSVAASLIQSKSYDAIDMATRFSQEYKREPGRGYGANVVEVFKALLSNAKDAYGPARRQFNGQGSYGNGAAMRIAPVALFGYNDVKKAVQIARQSSMITHSHAYGYVGGVLQCLAVHSALHWQGDNWSKFVDLLLSSLTLVNETQDPLTDSVEGSPLESAVKIYEEKLEAIKTHLKNHQVSTAAIVSNLGNSISAHNSVPAAIYAFLRHADRQGPTPAVAGWESSPLVQTIAYAISLGGDTDTIASMAGAMAGALHGEEAVPPAWLQVLEGAADALRLADQLADIVEAEAGSDPV